jgi:hypothetical protein
MLYGIIMKHTNIILSIMLFILKWFLRYYKYLYLFSICVVVLFGWFCLGYVNKTHVREKMRIIGLKINSLLFTCNLKSHITYLDTYMLSQIRTFNEVLMGLSEGVTNVKPTVHFVYAQDGFTQTISTKYSTVCAQTDKIKLEQKIVERIVEVIKEVPIEKIVYVEKPFNFTHPPMSNISNDKPLRTIIKVKRKSNN